MIYSKKILHIKIALLVAVSAFQFGFSQSNDSIISYSFSWSKIQPQKSLQPFYKALKSAKYGVQRFSIFDQLIAHHSKKANTDSILHYGNLYIKELNNWDKSEKEKNLYYAKAHYYMSVGNFLNGLIDKSIEWNITGLQKAEIAKVNEYEYLHKISLAKNYTAQANPNKAIPFLEEAINDFAKEYSEITNKALIALGNAHQQNKAYNKAKKYYQESLDLAKKFNDIEMALNCNLQQAKLLEAKKENNKALAAYMKIGNEAKKKGYDAIYFEASLFVAKLLYRLEDYNSALIGLSATYINAIDHENLRFQKEALTIQARCFSRLGDYKNAYAVMTQLFNVVNQIKEKQQKELIKELEIKYETLKKEQAISDLKEDQIIQEAELKRQKTIKKSFLIGFLIILVPIIALLYTYYQKIKAQTILANKQEEINQQKVTALKQEQEIKLIKALIEGQDEERKRIAQELHDSIGGNLAGIKLQLASVKNKTDMLHTISGQLDETYQLVRDISHTLIPQKFRQNNYVQLINEYATSISNAGEILVGFHSNPADKINTINEVVKMELFKIIQELMTNTIKHSKATKADINLNCLNNNINLLFEDNGIGFNTSEVTTGIGFENIKNRTLKLNGTIHIDSTPNRGTVISVDIPIKNTTNEL